MATMERVVETLKLGSVEIEVERRGAGAPLLLLASEEQLEAGSAAVDSLASRYEVIMPSAPGFGHSPRPDWMTNPDDISYVYLDLVEKLKLRDVRLMGFSLGGWIAAEMATKDDSFLSRLVLVDAYGIKTGGPSDVDIQDMWLLHPARVAALKWHDQDKGKRDFPSMSDDALTVVARNVESFARFCWEPYMHNPKLRRRLHRIDVPALVVWGANDGIVPPDYGRAYADMIKGARFETIANAGHYPHLEQPDAFDRIVSGFLA